jgi:L-alanine-DL-glutamate epimerase-like enolase superfamily enzyme
MHVEAIELRRVRIPLRRAFEHALHERHHADAVFVTVHDDAGNVGWGEVQPRPYVTGETIDGVLDHTGPQLAARLLRCELPSMADAVRWLEAAAAEVDRNLATLCGFDLALLDVAGQRFGVPVADVLGGVVREPLPAGVIIGFEHETAEVARYCATLRLHGKRHVKLKVGRDDDVERAKAVARVWTDVPLRLDANAAWSAEEAIERLRAIAAEVAVASIEQPVPADDLAGMRRIREATGIAVMADEAVCTLADARRLVEEQASDIFNVRLGKNGGLLASRRLVEYARQAGVAVHLGTMVGESGVLSTAAEVFGRCVEGFECLDGKGQNAFLLEVDILEDRSDHSFESAPGLGLRVAATRVREHQIDRTRRFEGDL